MECLAGAILDPICGKVGEKVSRHVGYIRHYNKNINELEDEEENLENLMKENKEKVETAETSKRNNIVKVQAEEWIKKAEDKKGEVEKLMVNKARDENMKCFNFSCPNLWSRYRMSKKAVQKKGDLEKLIGGGNFEVVPHSRPPPSELQFPSTCNFIDFDSRAQLLKSIEDGLKIGNPSGNPNDNMIGVYGPGGIGKTTVVEKVAKQLKENFFFDDIATVVVSRDATVLEIQDRLAKGLRLTLDAETELERQVKIWNRLNDGNNNLVILDDLWEKVKLRDIGIPLRQMDKGCKVILTTRDRRVLTGMEVGQYILVEVLNEEEAWGLFKKKVGITSFNFTDTEFYRVAYSVCKECGGLPVAILAIGGALAGIEDMPIWKEALDQQQNSLWENIVGIDRNMYGSLRWSYDYLGRTLPDAKSILLICCLYPEDDNIPVDFLLSHCIARRMFPDKNTVGNARNRIITLVRSLKDRSLLLDGKDKDHVKMHDVIRDVVISIAKTDEAYLVKNITNYWPVESINENMAAISVRLNKLKEVPNELVCPRLHTLRIECKDSSFQFPDSFFSGVGEITVLELKGIRMSSTPSSLANLSKLRTLLLINCKLEDMSFLKGLKSKLEVLVIADYDTKALPMELGELSQLRVLLLNECYKLNLIPAGAISKLTCLEELCLPDDFNFCKEFSGRESEDIEISRATLSEISSLTQLTNLSLFIPDVTLVPNLNFGTLDSYRIAVGEHFEKYEEYFKKRNLKLDGITYLDKVVTLLERAEVLFLYKVEGLKNVVLNKEGKVFLELEHFFIRDCHELEHLNEGLYQSNSFSKLTILNVSGCSFKFLFTSSCAKGLQQLQELDIHDCVLLEEIVGTEGEKDEQNQSNNTIHFTKLEMLHLSDLPKLGSFGPKIKENTTAERDSLCKAQPLFNEKVIFPALENLRIHRLPNITEIWDKQVLPTKSFPHLAIVQVCHCDKLVTVFPSNLWAESLTYVTVEECKGVKVVVSITGLEESEDANNCSIIFPQLRQVYLEDLENLSAFCGNSTGSKPQSLFDDPQVIFPALEKLHINRLPNVTEIWDKQVLPTKSFPHLANVQVCHCDKLVTLFPSNLWAESLTSVTVEECKGVKVVVSITGLEESEDANNCSIIFPLLRKVKLMLLENLNAFCGNSTGSKSQSLFDPQVIFPALEYLHIDYLPSITEIWDMQLHPTMSFPHLANVEIWYCDKLVTVFPSNSWARSNVREVGVFHCKGVKVVVSTAGLEESEDANNYSIFPQLRKVFLLDLENLYAFCGNSTGSKPQSWFDPQVHFPALVWMELARLPDIEIFKQQLSKGEVKFPAIRGLEIDGEYWYSGGKPNMKYLAP